MAQLSPVDAGRFDLVPDPDVLHLACLACNRAAPTQWRLNWTSSGHRFASGTLFCSPHFSTLVQHFRLSRGSHRQFGTIDFLVDYADPRFIHISVKSGDANTSTVPGGTVPSSRNRPHTMTVKRIVFNIATKKVPDGAAFYRDVLGLELLMDFGWIQTFGSDSATTPQLSIASQGGSGTAVPDVSIEVDNFDGVYRRCIEHKYSIEYGPVVEPWGFRRFYVRDPFGRLVNILTHVQSCLCPAVYHDMFDLRHSRPACCLFKPC